MTIKQQGGIFGRNPTFNDVTVENNMTIDGTTTVDKLGVGTNSPNTQLEIVNNTNNLARVRVSTTDTTPNNYRGYEFAQGSSFKGGLLQDQSTDSISIFTPLGGQSVIVYNNGNVSLNGGNLAFNSGNGIDFSATSGTGTSELFDDYEEGDFTPTLFYGGTEVGYYSRGGKYTKIGRQVFCSMQFYFARNAGAVTFGGLPFTSGTWGGSPDSHSGTTGRDYPTGTDLTGLVNKGATTGSLNYSFSGAGDSEIRMFVTYFV